MKEYDYIVIGTGSAMNLVNPILRRDPRTRMAIIDKDEPGGICLTRGCIPSKILLYHADIVRAVEKASEFHIEAKITSIDFRSIMDRMRTDIHRDVENLGKGLRQSPNIDYYPVSAEFTSPYTLRAGEETIKGKTIFLCIGSKPLIPSIKGLRETPFLTSDSLLGMERLPPRLAIVGGGYIAAEYGHFFSAMGSKVTIIGRNPKFLPEEEPEVSALAKKKMQEHMTIITGHEVTEVSDTPNGRRLTAVNRANGEMLEVTADDILVAAGRAPNTDILHPERAGIKTDKNGWIAVNEYFETSQHGVWAFGDADGNYPFKHVANYESILVYYNAVLGRRVKPSYHAVPHAVFSDPEIASVGLGQKEAEERYRDGILIGFHRYEDTAKGSAMHAKDFFVKVIIEKQTQKILGAHVIGPHASILIQEIINLMNTPDRASAPILTGMHIHPALSEVVARAFEEPMSPQEYNHLLMEHHDLPTQ